MGQPIVVTQKPTASAGVLRFEANRSLTGMSHLRYLVGQQIIGDRPPDELARRLFSHGGVERVHIFSNIITVVLSRGAHGDGIKEIVEGLYIYYREGVTPAIP